MEKCYDCGKSVRKPVYGAKHEETVSQVARCQRCHHKRVCEWERRNNGRKAVEIRCYDCGRAVRRPMYGPGREVMFSPVARCRECHNKRAVFS